MNCSLSLLTLLISGAGLALSQESANHIQTRPEAVPSVADLGLDCIKPPAIDPGQDFVGNFNNSCYAMSLASSRGGEHAGDLNARYGLGLLQSNCRVRVGAIGNVP